MSSVFYFFMKNSCPCLLSAHIPVPYKILFLSPIPLESQGCIRVKGIAESDISRFVAFVKPTHSLL